MLKEYYNYLVKTIVDYFERTNDIEGYKYSVTFENNDQVKELYEELAKSPLAEPFAYINEGVEVYRSFSLRINDKKLIVAATIGNVKTDFLTTLRNSIGTQKSEFLNAGLFIICDATLDSIANATQSFQKEGMPLHVDKIVEDIKKIVKNSTMNRVNKGILQYELDKRQSDTYKDNTSIFEYKEILGAINTGTIKEGQYKDFRIFYDPNLYNCEKDEEIKKRLKQNNYYFEKVDQSIRFGDPQKDLDNTFTEELIKKIDKTSKAGEWETHITYKEIEKSAEEKRNVEDIEVKGIEVYLNNVLAKENRDYFVKGIGSAKIQKRNKDLLIFNPQKAEDIKINIILSKAPNKQSLKTFNAVTKVNGKKIEVIVQHTSNTCSYESIRVTDDVGSSTAKVNLCIIDLPKNYLETLVTTYTLSVKKNRQDCFIYTNNEEDEIIFNQDSEIEHEIYLKNGGTYSIAQEEKLILKKTSGLIPENENCALVCINIEGLDLTLGINDDTKRLLAITGLGVWKTKIQTKNNFIYQGSNRVIHGASEFYTRDDFKEHLEIEDKIIDTPNLCWRLKAGELIPIELELDDDVKVAYMNFIGYFKVHKILPSLTYYSDELCTLGTQYIQAVIKCTDKVQDGESLPKAIKNIVKIGSIYCDDLDEQIKYTPLAPLNVAYQLKLYEVMDEEVLKDDSLLKKLTPLYLMPYIQDDYKNLYKPVEQWQSPEWAYYVRNNTKRYKGSRGFVSKLVKEKIEEFVDHFSYLFEQNRNSTIKINLVNTGDCKEVLQGICSYYVGLLKKELALEELNPIDINIYNTGNITHSFEEFSNYVSSADIKDKFGVALDTKGRYSDNDVIGAIREKLKFYDKALEDHNYEYAHITFIEMNQKSDTGIGNMSEISTGVSLNGLIAGVPSVHYGDSYRTGYGMKYIDEKSDLVKLTRLLNSVSRVSNTSNPYYRDQCITTELDRRDEEHLEKVYNASNWVTFIEPKVDLNFFKTSEISKDLLIIHYSDQYTTASGYDAITVTRKSRQYQSIIEEHLRQKGINDAPQYTYDIINMFNTINGDWLLRLISTKSYFDREKISILSAIKLSLAYFYHKDIIWVPISLEEILRVSGGAGLKKNEGIFSAKNLGFDNSGATSDDILLVGIENKQGKILLHYYPIEVKIGINASNYIQKAIEQVKKTKKIFMDTLNKKDEEVNLKTRIYRNFMIQLVIVSIEKFKLYDIWNEQEWDTIVGSDVRRKLLNEEYSISTELEQYIGQGGVVSFKKGLQFRTIKSQEDVTILEFTEEDGINYITKGITSIQEELIYGYRDIDKSELLMNRYQQGEEAMGQVKVEQPLAEQPNADEMYESVRNNQNEQVNEESTIDVSIVSEDISRPMEILFGTNQMNNQPLMWHPNDTDKVLHTNTGIIGTMGTGKTQFTKSLITQLYQESKYNLEGRGMGILIFDYKGDYNKSKQDFIDATGAKVYELYRLPYNPLSIMTTPNSKSMLPLHIASSLKETLAKGFGLGPIQSNLLKELIMEAYEGKGISKNDPATWDKTPPTLQDVYNRYIDREDLKQDSLYAAFSNLIDFEIFEPDATKTKPLFDLLEGVTVIDLSGYDESVQNLVVAITLDLFYSQMQSGGHSKIKGSIRQLSKMILVDEADNFISKGFHALKKILKEGREFGVGTILSTQLLSHFSTSDNDYANYILTWVVHNVADLSTKDVKYIFNTQSKAQEEELYNKIKNLEKHYSLVKMGDYEKSIYMRDKAFWELEKS